MDRDRRTFLKMMGIFALSPSVLFNHRPTLEIKALLRACAYLEDFCEQQTRKVKLPIIFAPHADYTHFHDPALWDDQKILDSPAEDKIDVGKPPETVRHLRNNIKIARQPSDKEVPIAERSLVTLANLIGRKRVPGKILVIKHFPGGEAELIESTEFSPATDQSSLHDFSYLTPFRAALSSAQGVMVNHVSYPRFEEDIHYDEQPIRTELNQLGIDETMYQNWTFQRPASLSPRMVRGLLKEKLQYSGFIFPDALGMGAVQHSVIKLSDKTTLPGDKAKQTLVQILGVYSGLDFFFNHEPSDIDTIKNYAHSSPYFSRCLEEGINRYRTLQYVIGHSDSVSAEAYFTNRLRYQWTDVWDNSSKLHQMFRRKFLATLFQDEELFSSPEQFWAAHNHYDWSKLSPLEERVLRTRYI